MTEQEAQQAQTIESIKMNVGRYGQQVGEVQHDVNLLLKIVDSQAQKITQQDSEIRAQKSALEVAAELLPKSRKERDEQAQKIAEQQAEVLRLRNHIMRQNKKALKYRKRLSEQAKEIERLK